MYISRHSCVASLLMFFAMPGLYATPVAINGTNINAIIKTGEVLTYENTQGTNISFSLKNRVLLVEKPVLKDIEAVKTYRNTLEKNKHMLNDRCILNQNIMVGKSRHTVLKNNKDMLNEKSVEKLILFKSNKSMLFNWAYVTDDKKVIVDVATILEIYDAVIKLPEVVFMCSALKVQDCFMDTPTLHIEPSCPHSLIKTMRITFNKEWSAPAGIQGAINFERNETEGTFMVLGAQKVEIVFAPAAFI